MFQTRRILYATDFSSFANQAYFQAVALAEHHNAVLTVVYVYSAASIDDGLRTPEQARAMLEQIRPSNPKIPVRHVLLEGDPASEIARYSRDAGIDVIVIGTHGRTGVERLLMGSVAESVMRNAPCSVLVVKMPRGQPTTELPVEIAKK